MRSRWWLGLAGLVVVLAACGGGESSSASGGSFCGQLSDLVGAEGLDSLDDPEAAAEAVQVFEDLTDSAPSEIRDDMEALTEFVEAFASVDPDDEEAAFEVIGEFLARGDELEAAGDRVERYARTECGIELDDDGTEAAGDLGDDADEATDEGTGDSGLFGADSPDTYGDDAALDALWDECEAGDLRSCDTLYLTTPFGSEYEEFGSTCGRTTAETQGQCSDGPLTGDTADDPQDYGDDPALDALWDGCDAGVLEDCDTLYFQSPIGSGYEFFGSTCGGRSDAGNGFCTGDLGSSQSYGDDPALDALWDGCASGVLADCDQLYWDSPIGSDYEAFGSTCGETSADTFGSCESPPDGGSQQTYGDDPALDVLWDECAAGSSDSCDELYFVSPIDSEYERFGSTCGETRNPTRGSCTLIDEGEPFDYGDDPTLDAFWDDCANGDGAACDELYFDSPIGSAYELFGETCGDRVEAGGDLCAEQIGVG